MNQRLGIASIGVFFVSAFLATTVQGCGPTPYVAGKQYYAAGNYDEAIAAYTQAIKRQPTNARAYFDRGLVYYKKREYDRALSDYNRAIELRLDDVEVYKCVRLFTMKDRIMTVPLRTIRK